LGALSLMEQHRLKQNAQMLAKVFQHACTNMHLHTYPPCALIPALGWVDCSVTARVGSRPGYVLGDTGGEKMCVIFSIYTAISNMIL
jgi:hypothetical protein